MAVRSMSTPMMFRIALSAALSIGAAAALAFDASVGEPKSPILLAQYFDHNTGEIDAPAEPGGGPDPAAMTLRVERLEREIRRLTGQNEELQRKVQVLEEQLRVANGGRPTESAAANNAPQPVTPSATTPGVTAASAPPAPTPLVSGRRGDAFDPATDPNAPGAPKPLGTTTPSAPLTSPPRSTTGSVTSAAPVREVGQPLDIAHGRLVGDNPTPAPEIAPAPEAAPLGPKEEYDEAVAMLKAGKFEAAEKSLQVFLAKNPKSKFAPAATFNIGRVFSCAEGIGKRRRNISRFPPDSASRPGAGRLAAAGPVARRHGRQGTGLRLLYRDRRQISGLGGAHPRRGAARKQETAMLTRRGARDA